MGITLFAIKCNAEFSIKKPEIDIGDYEKEKMHEVDSGDISDGNKTSE